jgi:hypothetical protein
MPAMPLAQIFPWRMAEIKQIAPTVIEAPNIAAAAAHPISGTMWKESKK